MLSTLELSAAFREGVRYANGAYKSERHFLDFVVDGQSLWERLGKKHDMVSVFCAEYPLHETAKAVDRFLLKEGADLPNGRRSLFICAECGDLGCGAITLRIEKHEQTIIWNSFGYENTYEPEVEFEEYRGAGPFMFDAATYERTIAGAADLLGPR